MEILIEAAGPAARALLQTLLNAAWQGGVIAAATAVLLPRLPRANAATRHAAWCAALAVAAVLPLLPLLRSGRAAPASAAGPDSGATSWTIPGPPDALAAPLAALLALVAVVRLLWLLRDLLALRRLKRDAGEVPAGRLPALRSASGARAVREARFGVSDGVSTPVTVGFLRPMILLPRGLLPRLDDEELRQIALHELAHLRRRDDWTNLAQRVLEAALFPLPAVRWIGTRVELEREIACDDEVVAGLASRRSYARCLTRLAELAVAARGPSLAPGAAPGRTQLARRVGALLRDDRPERAGVPRAAAVAVTLLAGAALTLQGAVPALTLTTSLAAPAVASRAPHRPARSEPAPPSAAAGVIPDAAVGPVATVRRPAAPAAAATPETGPAPEPRVVAACLSAACGRAPAAPAIVRRASVAQRASDAPRVAGAPAPPLRTDRAAAVELTLSLPFGGTVGRPGEAGLAASLEGPLGAPGWRRSGNDRGLLGALGRGISLRLRGGGGTWQGFGPPAGRR